MNRRTFIKTCGLSSLNLLALNSLSCRSKLTQSKPNFVFILVDDLGWKDLGCYGSSFYETPFVDRLASEGMQFTQAYAACPVCSPTRASIMTGKYPVRLSTTDYFGAPQPETVSQHWTRSKPLLPASYEDHLPLEEITLAEAFKSAGYNTFFAGKWHLGGQGFYPEDQGFDINKGGWKSGGPYGGNKYFSPYGNPRLEDGPEGEHLPDRLASETCTFIEDNKNHPFVAYLAFYSVHTPLISREDLKIKYEKKVESLKEDQLIWGKEGERKLRLVQNHAVYAGMVEAMDQAVGKVLDKLKTSGLEKNTVVFFMSDNGGLSTSEGFPTSNLPLRAGKGWLYEGGIREPMIIKWPGHTQPGSICEQPVISTDFYPTMLDITGVPLQQEQHKDGLSLVPLLTSKGTLSRDNLFWHYPHYGNQGGSPSGAIRSGDFKLIEFYEDGHLELYNLKQDIGETQNLVETLPEKTKDLARQLFEWRQRLGARMPTRNPNSSVQK